MIFNKQQTSQEPSAEETAESQVAEAVAEAAAGEATVAEVIPPANTEDAEKKYTDLYDQYVRLQADFENFRKRAADEKESALKYGAQKSILELLPVLDNLDRATSSLNETSEAKVLYQSFSLMQKQLANGLEKMGVKKIESVGQAFDPQFHEAVSQLESNEHPEGTVMYEAQSGYMLGDKVLRPVMVAVSSGPGPAGSEAPAKASEQPAVTPGSTEGENPFRQ